VSGQLFAFRVAKPAEPSTEETVQMAYDPQSQTSVWQGGTDASAAYCTDTWFGRSCRQQYGSCWTFGTYAHGYRCD
jgi:hypothetical protein